MLNKRDPASITKQKYKDLTRLILDQYRNQVRIFYHPTLTGGEAYLENRLVFLEKKYQDNPNEWSVFTTLHEIGHILTNNNKQLRCVQEYLATQWALDRAREYDLTVSSLTLKTYQDYIWKYRDSSQKRKCKNVPDREALTLKP